VPQRTGDRTPVDGQVRDLRGYAIWHRQPVAPRRPGAEHVVGRRRRHSAGRSPAADPTDGVVQHLLLLAGRSGVGKNVVGWEVSAQLGAAGVAHCLLDGDLMCACQPAPAGDPDRTDITRANLAAVWANYAALGYRRLVYLNTVSVLSVDWIVAAMGGQPIVTKVLLTCSDGTAAERLRGREVGTEYDWHVERSRQRAADLDRLAPSDTIRVGTDRRTVPDVAAEVVRVCGWVSAGQPER
jgi:hypothetical protein